MEAASAVAVDAVAASIVQADSVVEEAVAAAADPAECEEERR